MVLFPLLAIDFAAGILRNKTRAFATPKAAARNLA